MLNIRSIFIRVVALILAAHLSVVYAQEASLRPEVGKPLQAAQELIKARKYREALAKIQEAEAAAKSPYETFMIERMRGSAAAQAGDNETAARSFENVIASGRLPKSEQLKLLEAVAGIHYRARDYNKAAAAASRYFKEGGTDPQVKTILTQSYFLSGDCGNAVREVQAQVQSAEQAGRTPAEEQLQLLANCQFKRKDQAGYATALEKLLTYYPKKEYWTDVIRQTQKKPGFSDRLALDVFRLRFASSNLGSASDYMEMTQLALQAGLPSEAKKVIEQGFADGTLGKGSDADRQKRLRDLTAKSVSEAQANLAKSEAEAKAAKDGTQLVNVGFEYVSMGQFDKGLALMEEGIRKGGLKRPEDAKLRLGVAYYLAGQRNKSVQLFRTVQGGDGTADLARLWALHARRSA